MSSPSLGWPPRRRHTRRRGCPDYSFLLRVWKEIFAADQTLCSFSLTRFFRRGHGRPRGLGWRKAPGALSTQPKDHLDRWPVFPLFAERIGRLFPEREMTPLAFALFPLRSSRLSPAKLRRTPSGHAFFFPSNLLLDVNVPVKRLFYWCFHSPPPVAFIFRPFEVSVSLCFPLSPSNPHGMLAPLGRTWNRPLFQSSPPVAAYCLFG